MHIRKILFILLIAALMPLASASADPNDRYGSGYGGWTTVFTGEACIGGYDCDRYGDKLRLRLSGGAVDEVRFYARDRSRRYDGQVRIVLGGYEIEDCLDVSKRGRTYTYRGYGKNARSLVFENPTHGEVVISRVEVRYRGYGYDHRGGSGRGDYDYDSGYGDYGNRGNGGYGDYDGGYGSGGYGDDSYGYGDSNRYGLSWRTLRGGGCFGGEKCRDYGKRHYYGSNNRLEFDLNGEKVYGIRFYAHDRIGNHYNGAVRVRLGRRTVASYVDIRSSGKYHEFRVDGVSARDLVFEALKNDEVVIEKVEILVDSKRRGRWK